MKITIKILTSLAVFAILNTTFFSCGDDEEPVNPLVGTWTLTQKVFANCDDPRTLTFNCAASIYHCQKVTFTNDGKFTLYFGDGSVTLLNGTYSTSGNQITIDISGSHTLTYNINGNTLTTSFDQDDCDVTETYTK